MTLTQLLVRRLVVALLAGAVFAGGSAAVRQADLFSVTPSSAVPGGGAAGSSARPTLRDQIPAIAELFTWEADFSGEGVTAEDHRIQIPGYDDPLPTRVPPPRAPAPAEPLEVLSSTPFERRLPPGGSTGDVRPPTPSLGPSPTTTPDPPPTTAPTGPEPPTPAEPPAPAPNPAAQP